MVIEGIGKANDKSYMGALYTNTHISFTPQWLYVSRANHNGIFLPSTLIVTALAILAFR